MVTATDLALLVNEHVEPLAGGEHHRVFRIATDDHPLRLVGNVADGGPPLVEMRPHLHGHFRVVVDHVLFLQRIGLEIVQFAVAQHSPPFPEHRAAVSTKDGGRVWRGKIQAAGHAAVVGDQHAFSRDVGLAAHRGGEADAVELALRLGVAEVEQRREQILRLRQPADVARLAEATAGPAHEARHTVAALPQLGLSAAHAGGKIGVAEGAAVVGHKKQDGVFRQAGLVEERHESAHVGIDVADHREVAHEVAFGPGRHARQPGVGYHFLHHLDVLVWRVKRPVRRVGRQVGEERFPGRGAALDPVDGVVEENVGAVAGESFAFAVPAVGVVEVVVAPVIRYGADVRGGEPERLLEAAILRAVRVVVAKVPLAEDAGAVALFAEQVGHCR